MQESNFPEWATREAKRRDQHNGSASKTWQSNRREYEANPAEYVAQERALYDARPGLINDEIRSGAIINARTSGDSALVAMQDVVDHMTIANGIGRSQLIIHTPNSLEEAA